MKTQDSFNQIQNRYNGMNTSRNLKDIKSNIYSSFVCCKPTYENRIDLLGQTYITNDVEFENTNKDQKINDLINSLVKTNFEIRMQFKVLVNENNKLSS